MMGSRDRKVKNRRLFRVLAWRFKEVKGWAVLLWTHFYIPHKSLGRDSTATVARYNRNIGLLV